MSNIWDTMEDDLSTKYQEGVKDGRLNIINRLIMNIESNMIDNKHEISESSNAIRNYQKNLLDLLNKQKKDYE